jgi:hypothetical protein
MKKTPMPSRSNLQLFSIFNSAKHKVNEFSKFLRFLKLLGSTSIRKIQYYTMPDKIEFDLVNQNTLFS